MDLAQTDMLDPELTGRAVEIFREPSNGAVARTCGSLGVIAAIQFLKHLLS
jgi:hypothetical protein